MKQVNFNKEITITSNITIYDDKDNEVEDIELFSNIIDDIGFALDYETTYVHEYQGNQYKVVVENTTEETQYIDFEVY